MSRPTSHIEYDGAWREARIILVLDVDQAEGIATALGDHDGGALEIRALVAEARALEASMDSHT